MKNLFVLLLLFIANLSFSQTIYERGNILFDTIKVEEVSVTSSYSAVKETPFSFTNLNNSVIAQRLTGSEPAVLLSSTPSVFYHSDNGLNTGYIYYRLRGIDQSRINSTFNGVPMNEPEDQGIYYNNFYNFLGSVGNVQIIRGAGLSKSGVSSYGGSMNFNSLEFPDKTKLNYDIYGGSYGTFGTSGGISTPNFFLNASYGKTDGFKENAFNKSKSIFYGAKSGDLTFYGFVSNQKNGMGWLGEPIDSIYKNPRYNSNTPDETDDFTYVHNQLHWKKYGFTTTLYHTYIAGWYDTDIAHFDPSLQYGDLMNRIQLKSNWFGTVLNYNLKLAEILNTNYGVSAYTYYRDHSGFYNGELDYENRGTRNEVSPYAKGELKVKWFSLYGDVQYRHSIFAYEGSTEFETQKYNFLNWSGGLSIRTGVYSNIYYGIGRTHREPTRTDLFSGWDNYDAGFYNPTVPESVLDYELGFRYNTSDLNVTSNLYYMSFENEIVLNGQVGPNSILLHQNVDNSYRSGLELDVKYFISKFDIKFVGNVSRNRIFEDGETFQPVLTPSVILNSDVRYNIFQQLYVGLNPSYVGESYIDFANEHVLDPRLIINGYVGMKFKRLELIGNLNNITNQLVLGNAVMGYDGDPVMGYDGDPLYFVMAKMNGLVTLKINL